MTTDDILDDDVTASEPLAPAPGEVPLRLMEQEVQAVGVGREVVGILRDAILSGRLQPGQRLNEVRLAAELGVSRPPLREAIRTLEGERLVSSAPRRGAFVRVLTARDIQEIYTVRYGLEALASELIVAGGETVGVADDLDRRLDSVEDKAPNLSKVIEGDLEFHRALVEAAGNVRLLAMWERVVGEIRLALTLVDSDFFNVSYFEATHRELIAALRAGDADRCRQIISALREVGLSLERKWHALSAEANLS